MSDDTDEPAETGSDPAAADAEGRASEGARGRESGSNTDEGNDLGSDFEQLWQSLRPPQKKVAQEYIFTTTKADAAREVGLHPDTVYDWPDKVWEASEKLVDKRAKGIGEGMSALSPSALDVLRRALDPDESVSRVESETAQYLLNQLEGKPTQKQVQEHKGGIDLDPDDEDAIDDALGHLD